ncbi:signal peptidase II [Pseudokordiimonas caeni]|uniref:signal peptidase II n=1 Tax=Pseudokordiimonas caeni TaxID=2997908 RepID=UPI0028127B36|nr:signal peptidase II [Pseudokordiimonas caeni]
MKSKVYFTRAILGALAILVIDQLVKIWVLQGLDLPSRGSVEVNSFLSFTMIWNKGISLGIGLDEWVGKSGLIILTLVITAILLRWLTKTERILEVVGLSLIIGGAISNLIDRFIHGAVVDFVHLHVEDYSFYVFNVADAAITFGVIFMIYDGLRSAPEAPTKANGKPAGPQ